MSKTLILPRTQWESELMINSGYSFTKEQLDAAEKKEPKFIGTINGVDCYLTTLFKNKNHD